MKRVIATFAILMTMASHVLAATPEDIQKQISGNGGQIFAKCTYDSNRATLLVYSLPGKGNFIDIAENMGSTPFVATVNRQANGLTASVAWPASINVQISAANSSITLQDGRKNVLSSCQYNANGLSL